MIPRIDVIVFKAEVPPEFDIGVDGPIGSVQDFVVVMVAQMDEALA